MTKPVVSHKFDTIFDQGRHVAGKLGFVLLASEQTVTDDMYRICPRDVGLHFNRVNSPDLINTKTLSALAPELTHAAAGMLPDGGLDVVSYACTSGSLVLGEAEVHRRLSQGASDAQASCIIAAVIRALNAVKANKLVVLTPYLDEVNTAEKAYLEQSGFSILDIQGLNLALDSDMVRVSPQFILETAASLDHSDADAVFISCGALRSIDIIDQLEQRLNKPVVTSNQALAWDALRLCGYSQPIHGFGQLLADPTIQHRVS